MNTYIVKARSGMRVRVCSDDLLEAGREFKRQRRGEELVSIRLMANTPKTSTTVVDGATVSIPAGYYRVRKGKTKAGDLAWWAKSSINTLHGFHPVDAIPPGQTLRLNELGDGVDNYYCILRKED